MIGIMDDDDYCKECVKFIVGLLFMFFGLEENMIFKLLVEDDQLLVVVFLFVQEFKKDELVDDGIIKIFFLVFNFFNIVCL